MSEKYYVVSESELENLRSSAYSDGRDDASGYYGESEADKAEAACRARPVPKAAKDYIESVWGYFDDN